MTAHAAAGPVPNPLYPVRGRSKVHAAAADAPAAAQIEVADARNAAVDRDRTALALAMSAAGAVGVFVAGVVAVWLIAGAEPDAGEAPDATHALVAEAR